MPESNLDQVDLKRLSDECGVHESEVRRAFGERTPEEIEFEKRAADAQTREELVDLLQGRDVSHTEAELYALHRLLGLSETSDEVSEILDRYSLDLYSVEVSHFVLRAAQKLNALLGEGIRVAKDADVVCDLLDKAPGGSATEALAIRKLAGFYRK
jgi:hypothetical protein